ncbi:XrtA/PEP-CTERM system TPR-repeat protein PrsT [uncultured Thiohalocapsa sp.]|uniref:XrtA/PEP-CTERM system TPR-repeat protein PrsT n=1 Tax=uncultured Thiohalocapsa sp. TaxID=768990 RepID=UPI0025DCF227|nr:XrtA/PEP-CTERM system TPR-repeat protein PrsT [uncultured Thiohalocapsa sp.]
MLRLAVAATLRVRLRVAHQLSGATAHPGTERGTATWKAPWAITRALPQAFLSLALSAVVGCSGDAAPDLSALFDEAEQLQAAGQTGPAEAALTRAVQLEPESAMARWRLGNLLYDMGQFEFAATHLNSAMEHGMQASSVLPLLARVLLRSGAYDKLLELDLPADISREAQGEVMAHQAVAELLLDRIDAGRARLTEAAQIAPGSEAVGVANARLLAAAGRREAAEEQLRDLILRYPSSADALGLLADLTRDLGRLREAEVLYGRALVVDRFAVHLHFLRGEVRLDLGWADAAAKDADAVHAVAPDTFADHYLRGRLLLLRGEPEAALTRLEAAGKLKPSHIGTLLYGGVSAYALGRINLAEDWLSRVLKAAPESVAARSVLGALRFSQGRHLEVERLLRPVVRAHSDTAVGSEYAMRILAASLIAQDKAADAVPLLSRLVQADPEDPRTQLDLSIAQILSGAGTRGEQILDGLLARHPGFVPAYEYLTAYHVRRQNWAEALRWTQLLQRRYPEEDGPVLLEAEVLLAAGRLESAQQVLDAALSIAPDSPRAHLRHGELALRRGDTTAADKHFKRILEDRPEHLDALVARAGIASKQGRADDAVRLLQAAVDSHPGILGPRLKLAPLVLAQGDAAGAVAVLQQNAVPAFRREPSYLRLLAETMLVAGTPQQAAEVARELVALEPDSLSAYSLYARILTVLDDKVALEDTLRQMLTIEPGHVPTLLELVRLQIATGRFEVGERLLGPVLAEIERPALADFLYGLILMATERPVQAIGPLRHAYSRAPSQRVLLALANAEAQGGRLEDAISRESKWLEERPDDVSVRVNLAAHLVQAGRISDAIAQYEQVLATRPDHVVALNNLAWYAMEQDVERAISYAQRALEARPDSLDIAHTLVTAQVEAGQWRDAELTLDRALARYPTDPGLLWLSARVLHQKGRDERAVQRLERLLNNDLSSDQRERARGLLAQIQDELRAEEAEQLW